MPDDDGAHPTPGHAADARDETAPELSDFGERYEQARQRSRARREAFEAVRARAAGKSRDQIREMYVAELTSRGVAIPAELILNAIVERIAGNPAPAGRALSESLAQVGKGLYGLTRVFRQR
ncbi:MAG TPA: hypothetical protein VGG25_30375 [Streptosporangiaceae bacterium]|jgi:hypothetical protein